jgi:hypothetical protein
VTTDGVFLSDDKDGSQATLGTDEDVDVVSFDPKQFKHSAEKRSLATLEPTRFRNVLTQQGAVSQISVRQSEYESSTLFLVCYALTLALSSMQYTCATCEVGTVAAALQYQLGWGRAKADVDFYTSVLATSSIVGITFGSLAGGQFIAHGRRWTCMVCNTVGLLASLAMFTYNYKVMCAGRLVFGFTSGVLLCATPAMIDETIPASLVDKGFGASTSIAMCCFQFLLLLMAIGMPDSAEGLATTHYWFLIMGLHIPFQALSVLLFAFVFTEEPIDFSIKSGDKEAAMKLISRVYAREDGTAHRAIYDQQAQILSKSSNENGGSVLGALTDERTSGSSWMCIAVAIFNNLGGVGIVNIFATQIFDTVLSRGASSKLSAKQDTYFIGGAAFVGAILSYYSIAIFSRRTIFIGGHFFMAALLTLTGYFIRINEVELVLLTICSHIIVYQATQGAVMFIYIAEIANHDGILGLCVFVQMVFATLQSMSTTALMSGALGVDGLFFVLGVVQVIALVCFSVFMKETQGLKPAEKKQLYTPAHLRAAEKKSLDAGKTARSQNGA